MSRISLLGSDIHSSFLLYSVIFFKSTKLGLAELPTNQDQLRFSLGRVPERSPEHELQKDPGKTDN